MPRARDGYPSATALFAGELQSLDGAAAAQEEPDDRWRALPATLDDGLLPRVHVVNRLTPTIVEVVVYAPFAARRFVPGQFFRLQNFEATAPVIDGTRLVM